MGADLSGVRVHTDGQAARSAAALHARAYTVGTDIVFGAGEYDPTTDPGRRLLAHELVHSQQAGGLDRLARRPVGEYAVSDPADTIEREAEDGADAILTGRWTPDRGRNVAATRTRRSGGLVLRKHKREFQDFAARELGAPSLLPGSAATPADVGRHLGVLLDHNEYERRELANGMTGDLVLRASMDWVRANTKGVDVAGPSGPLMQAMRHLLSSTNTAKVYSEISWQPATAWGAATQMTSILHRGGHATGSDAGGDPEWMLRLQQRVDGNGRSLYVRGHMLNRHLGGPGLDYNMVPLTATGAWGANDANGAHSSLVEETIKRMADKLETGAADQVTNLRYGVRAIYDRTPRPQTATVRTYQQLFQKGVDDFRKAVAEHRLTDLQGVDAKSDAEVQQIWKSVTTPLQFGATQPAPYPTPSGQYDRNAVIGSLRLGMSAPIFATQIAKLDDWVRTPLVTAVDANAVLVALLNAVTPHGSYKLDTMERLAFAMKENAELWELEDKHLPSALAVEAHWDQFGQTEDINEKFTVRLPSSLNAAFRLRNDG